MDSLEKDLAKEIRTESIFLNYLLANIYINIIIAAILQKITSVIDQALRTYIYNVNKRGLKSRVSVCCIFIFIPLYRH